jgi:hypothetical protein
MSVPVELTVADWTLPRPQDFRTWVELVQSPDTLAIEYKVPLWSDRHWELIAQSFRLMSASGSRVLYIPLIAESNFGNAESMVRWVDTGDGKYEHDFSIMEKYLDVAEKNLGTPKLVVFHVWDVYVLSEEFLRDYANKERRTVDLLSRRGVKGGPIVTVKMAGSDKIENRTLPAYTDPDSKALWGPLYDGLRNRMEKHGLGKAMALGTMTDVNPTKQEVAAMAELAPGTPWTSVAHIPQPKDLLPKGTTFGYIAQVYGYLDPDQTGLQGWKRPDLFARFYRWGDFDSHPNFIWRELCEISIAGDQRGVARLGADYWPIVRKEGRKYEGAYSMRADSRFPSSSWRNLGIYTSLLAAGVAGPEPTAHYLHLVEGIQECEARIAIEMALSDEPLKAKLGDDLARRCQAALDERVDWLKVALSGMGLEARLSMSEDRAAGTVAAQTWYAGSRWQDRTEKLYTLAGEVTRKLGQ